MNRLKAGFARADITPMTGIPVRGYYKKRYADGVLDPLEVCALALSCGEDKVLLICLDNCGFDTETMTWYRERIAKKCGIPADAMFISCTHTHTGPFIHKPGAACTDEEEEIPDHGFADTDDPLVAEYTEIVGKRLRGEAPSSRRDVIVRRIHGAVYQSGKL